MSIIKLMLFSILLALSTFAYSQDFSTIGFKQIAINDVNSERPLQVAVWYPTNDSTPTTLFADNAVFYGFQAINAAQPINQPWPLVVLSHGHGGSWRNLSWLAAALVQQGYIVAAPNHPGTTTFNQDPLQAAQLWQRPRDLTRIIDHLIDTPAIAGEIDHKRIAAIGHSLGGWTVMAAGGARFSTKQFAQDCALPNHSILICGLTDELGLAADNDVDAKQINLTSDLRDPRIGAVVSLDLGIARGFTAASLNEFPIPALIIGAGFDTEDLAVARESGYIANLLPESSSNYIVMPVTHFSFFQQCKPGAEAIIAESIPDEAFICEDGETSQNRNMLHQEIARVITQFLAEVLVE